ncbi:MAG: type II secretion system protein GspK [Armatimonadota bacterium]
MIIIAVLGALSIVLALILNFTNTATFNEEYLYRIKSTEKAYYMSISVLPSVLKIFMLDDPAFDSFTDTWAQTLPVIKTKEGNIYIRISDEDRKFNPNYIIKEDKEEKYHKAQFERLLNLLSSKNYLDNKVSDWIDKDSQATLPGGVEDNLSGINFKNAPLDSIYEILYIQDAGEEDFYGSGTENRYGIGLNKLLTVHSGGKVNINTAPKVILESIDEGVTSDVAEAIIKRRIEKPFKNIKEILDIPGMNLDILYKIEQVAGVSSSFYNINIIVDTGEVKPSFTCIVKREEESIKPVLWKVE